MLPRSSSAVVRLDPDQLVHVDNTGAPDLRSHLLHRGALPKYGEPTDPWTYRGWMLPYVQLHHRNNIFGFPDRYTYGIAAGGAIRQGVDPGPIPRVDYALEPHLGVLQHLQKLVGNAAEHRSQWEGFCAFLSWVAFGLDIEPEASQLKRDTQLVLYRDFNPGDMFLEPHDYFGALIERGPRLRTWNPTQYRVPPHLDCELWLSTLLVDRASEDLRPMNVLNPDAGTGRMSLLSCNYHWFVTGVEPNPVLRMAARINAALYAPWMQVVATPPVQSGKEP